MKKISKQQIAAVRSALKEIHAELLAWDPHVLVLFEGQAQKDQIIARMSQLGWHFVNDPSNETADLSIAEFSLDPISLAATAPYAGPASGRVRRVKLPAPFFASFGIISALVGIMFATATFYEDYQMKVLDKAGTQTMAEIERTYFTSGRGGRTYNVSYRFVDAHGISHDGDDEYPLQKRDSLRSGAPISVTYLADNPERNSLTQRVRLVTGRNLKDEITLLGIPWIIAGCFFLGYWVRKRPSS